MAEDALAKPKIWDPFLQILLERGAAHEQSFRFSSFKTMGVPAPAFVAQARLRLAADAGRRVHDLMVERAVGVGALHAGLRTKITLLTSPAAISDSPHSKRWVAGGR